MLILEGKSNFFFLGGSVNKYALNTFYATKPEIDKLMSLYPT